MTASLTREVYPPRVPPPVGLALSLALSLLACLALRACHQPPTVRSTLTPLLERAEREASVERRVLRSRADARTVVDMPHPFSSAFASAVLDALRHQTQPHALIRDLSPITLRQALDAAASGLEARVATLRDEVRRLYVTLEDEVDPVKASLYAERVHDLAAALDALGRR